MLRSAADTAYDGLPRKNLVLGYSEPSIHQTKLQNRFEMTDAKFYGKGKSSSHKTLNCSQDIMLSSNRGGSYNSESLEATLSYNRFTLRC